MGETSAGVPGTPSRWSALWELGLLCVAMLVGAFGAGLLPLYAAMSQRQLNTFNSLGTGLMLGTSLAVIIPEGLEQLYRPAAPAEGEPSLSNETVVGLALVSGFLLMMCIDQFRCLGGGGHGHGSGAAATPSRDDLRDLGLHSERHHERGDAEEHGSLVVELSSLGKGGKEAAQGQAKAHDLAELPPEAAAPAPGVGAGAGAGAGTGAGAGAGSRPATVTVGLLVHAMADGFALGAAKAASGESWHHVEMVVFLAIMMHKVPAAFALTIYLRSARVSTHSIRCQLLLFALAAPLGALLIFLLLHRGFLGLGSVSSQAVGFALVLSGGTFLYVALVHAFQELPRDHRGDLKLQHFAAFCFGCVLPLLLAAGHDHD
jgi:zinc transporter 9